jgi:hypothetical protein
MVSILRFGDKLNDAANFKGMSCICFSSYIIQQSMSMGCTRDLVQANIVFNTFRRTNSPFLTIEAPGPSLIDEIVKFQIAHIKFDSCYSTSKHYSCDKNI